MSSTQINFYNAVSTSDYINIFVPPGDFDAHVLGAEYRADLFRSDKFLVVKVKGPEVAFLAIDLKFSEEIQMGKEVRISHLHPTLHYILEQAILKFG